jgi:hypothetical protein
MLKVCELIGGLAYINFFSQFFRRKISLFPLKKVDFVTVWLIKKAGLFVCLIAFKNQMDEIYENTL